MKSEVEQALDAHALWRKRFKDYLNGRAAFDVANAGATDQCQFGQWLNREGYRLMPTDLYGQIREAHDDFHRVAASIIQKIKDKQFADARQDLSASGPFNQASERLAGFLLRAKLREPGKGTAKEGGTKPDPASASQPDASPPES